MNRRSGFTLIELLVIISIIGILSAVVITFVQSAKDRASDAAVRKNLEQLRTAIALLDQPPLLYYTVIPIMPCLGNDGRVAWDANVGLTVLGVPSVRPLVEAAAHAAGVNSNSPQASCVADGAWPPAWAVAIKLRSSSDEWWCVDGQTTSKLVKVGNFEVDPPIDPLTRTCK